MFKRLAATPQYIAAGYPVLRLVADSSRSVEGASGTWAADDTTLDEREPVPSTEDVAFERAVARWQARGYQILYRDEYLVQLVRSHRLDRLLAALIVAGVAGLLVLVLARRARLTQPWHVVTLARTPDERVITHEQWSTRPPAA